LFVFSERPHFREKTWFFRCLRLFRLCLNLIILSLINYWSSVNTLILNLPSIIIWVRIALWLLSLILIAYIVNVQSRSKYSLQIAILPLSLLFLQFTSIRLVYFLNNPRWIICTCIPLWCMVVEACSFLVGSLVFVVEDVLWGSWSHGLFWRLFFCFCVFAYDVRAEELFVKSLMRIHTVKECTFVWLSVTETSTNFMIELRVINNMIIRW